MDIILSEDLEDDTSDSVMISTQAADVFEIAGYIARALVVFGFAPASVARVFSDEVNSADPLMPSRDDDIPPEKSSPPSWEECNNCQAIKDLGSWFEDQIKNAPILNNNPQELRPVENISQDPIMQPEIQRICRTCEFSVDGKQLNYGTCVVCHDKRNWRERS